MSLLEYAVTENRHGSRFWLTVVLDQETRDRSRVRRSGLAR
ncbi:hypothetical protein SP21_78 [Salmonella phage 21]|nr:hypothetical protein SP21_78 [Salmonella phage 21]